MPSVAIKKSSPKVFMTKTPIKGLSAKANSSRVSSAAPSTKPSSGKATSILSKGASAPKTIHPPKRDEAARRAEIAKKISPEYLAAIQAALKRQGKAMSLPADKPKPNKSPRGTRATNHSSRLSATSGVSKPRSTSTVKRPSNSVSLPPKEVEVVYQLFTGERSPRTREMIWYYPKRARWTPSSKDYKRGKWWYAQTEDGLVRYEVLPGQGTQLANEAWDGVRQDVMYKIRSNKLIG
ncbi:hypothetical protein ABW19_dt0209512 [Dactylella cylindrospora]|nr:hypothetical protein ABW19_dt0209512 [Dactylella cylindrospora]